VAGAQHPRRSKEDTLAVDVLEAIRKRRSIRDYRCDEIPDDVLGRLLESLRLAPTGGNRQPFKFIIVRDAATKKEVAAACRWLPGMPDGQAFIADAPVVVVACGVEKDAVTRFHKDGAPSLTMGIAPDEIDRDPVEYNNLMAVDMAIALDHLTLVAAEEGLGTCWVAALDEPELKRLLAVPEEMRLLFVMPVGYATSWPEPRPRKALEDIVCWDSYS